MSQEESATVENVEECKQPLVAELKAVTTHEVIEPWGSKSILQFVMAVFSVPFLILSAVYMKYAAESVERDDILHNGTIAGLFMLIFLAFVYYSCSNARLGFNPSLIWGAAAGHDVYLYEMSYTRAPSGDDRESSSQQDVESPSSGNSETRQVDAGPSDPCTFTASGEREMLLQTSASESVCKVKEVSEVASAISKIALETVVEKGESMESSTSADEQPTPKETLQVTEKTDPDTELTSSGELRLRKMGDPGECKDSSSSSGEDPANKE